ncbi:hypothetical protein ACYSNO_07010 [Enterococcus sp. LJL98]
MHHSERNGLEENRESFREAKNKSIFEAEVDKKRAQVTEKKAEKAEKRELREHK